MKKASIILILLITFSFNTFCQGTDKNLSFCKQYFTSESLLKLSMKYNENEENFNLFIIETNKAATRAQNLLDEIEPTLKSKLTKEELEDLKASVKFIFERSSQSSSFDQPTLMKLSVWFQLTERKLISIFPKLMK